LERVNRSDQRKGSRAWSKYQIRIHMFLGLPNPDPDVWIRIRIQILLSSSKKVRKTLIPSVL
jgi:hypothetical protein